MSNLSALLIQDRIRVVGVDTLLTGVTSIGTALLGDTLEFVLSSTARILRRSDLRSEASVRGVGGEASLGQVVALGLLVLISVGDIGNVARRLAAVVLAGAAGWSLAHLLRGGVLAGVEVHLLLSSGRAACVTGLGEVLSGEVALAAQGFGVLLLAGAVFAEAANRGGGESGSA